LKVPGVVIDHSPAESGRYIGSPSIAVLPDATYLASHDFFGPKADHERSASSAVFSSRDQGATWEKIAEIRPLLWGKLFLHQDDLYLLGTHHEYGEVLLYRSGDGGRTWTQPHDSRTGLLREGRHHCAPCPTLVQDGRIWRSMERFTGGAWGHFSAAVMSAPVDADLLNAASWTFSRALPKPQEFTWLEGNVLPGPDGRILDLLRTNDGGKDRAAMVHVADEGKTLSYDPERDFIRLPGGGAKFTIRFDKTTSRYWAVVNKQTKPEAFRNNLLLTSSVDLRTWQIEAPLLYHPDKEKHAWQYVDWQFDGEDIIFVSRTAFDDGLGGAHSAHDANYLTFHRIQGFRKGWPECVPRERNRTSKSGSGSGLEKVPVLDRCEREP